MQQDFEPSCSLSQRRKEVAFPDPVIAWGFQGQADCIDTPKKCALCRGPLWLSMQQWLCMERDAWLMLNLIAFIGSSLLFGNSINPLWGPAQLQLQKGYQCLVPRILSLQRGQAAEGGGAEGKKRLLNSQGKGREEGCHKNCLKNRYGKEEMVCFIKPKKMLGTLYV